MPFELGNRVEPLISLAKTGMKFAIDGKTMLMLYNEAFYLSTRVVYEHDANARPEAYMEKIIDNIGNKEWSKLVIFIMFVIITLQANQPNEVQEFVDKLQKTYFPQTPFKIVNSVNKMPSWMTNILRKLFMLKKFETDFRLKPCPYPADKLKGIDWNIITQGFSKHVIIDILDLWDNDNEKGKVIRLIENAYTSHQPELDDKETKEKADGVFFTQQKNLYNETKIVIATKDDIEKCFRYNPSDYEKESIMMVVKKFFLGKPSNLALIETVLFDHGLLKTRDNHTPLVKILKDWGALHEDLDVKNTANGMSQKIRKLPEDTYKEWSENYKRDRTKCIKIEDNLQVLNRYGR